MPFRNHSGARKLATVALARLVGVGEAAKVSGVKERTVREWMAAHRDADTSVQEWQAAHDHAMELHLRASLSGDARGAFQWSQSAGVTQRNLNYQRWISKREAKRAEAAEADKPEPLSPEGQAINALPPERRRWLVEYLFGALEAVDRFGERGGEPATGEEGLRAAISRAVATVGKTPEERIDFYATVATAPMSELEAIEDKAWEQAATFVKDWRVYRERRDDQWWYTILRPSGDIYSNGSNFLRPPFSRLPIIDGGPEPNALDVTPDQRWLIEQAEHFLETSA